MVELSRSFDGFLKPLDQRFRPVSPPALQVGEIRPGNAHAPGGGIERAPRGLPPSAQRRPHGRLVQLGPGAVAAMTGFLFHWTVD